MIKCPFCHKVYVANTIFCNECGHYLLEDDERETDALEKEVFGQTDQTGESNGQVNGRQLPTSRPVTIRLRINDRREVELPLKKTLWIGRIDPAENVFPEIDVSDDGAAARSVSRRHARISRQNDLLLIEDLGSVNGTFVNQKRLSPYLPEKLKEGDSVQLGTLQMKVTAVKQEETQKQTTAGASKAYFI